VKRIAFALAALATLGAGAQERTVHPALPHDLAHYWFVPELGATRSIVGAAGEDGAARFARGVNLVASQQYAAALPLVSARALAGTPLADYAQYYTGVALAGVSRLPEADAVLTALLQRRPEGPLRELATLRLADVVMARKDDPVRAKAVLRELDTQKVSVPEEVLLQLGQAEEQAGHVEHALDAFRRVYYDYPLSAQAAGAQAGLERLETPALLAPDRFVRELARAERLFAARRWAQARPAFAAIARAARGEQAELIALRLAECDHHLGRHAAAIDGLTPHLKGGPREAEARFFHLTSVRALGNHASYVALARRLVSDHPRSEWAAETLNSLASHYIGTNDGAEADRVFRELRRRFPEHRHAERAAWRIGWAAYRAGRFTETANVFEEAAVASPRADYRPAWLYWSGRARDRAGDRAAGHDRYRLTVTDYQNSYYGRLASSILESRRQPPVPASVTAARAAPQASVPNDAVIRALSAIQLYDDALREVQYAQRVWGDSAALQATVAWIRYQQAQSLTATERFTALRGAITMMRRAYPQFMAAGGEHLPPDVLRIIFPIDYWPLITKYSAAHQLDPYLIAALIAQESTFTAEIRSSANAHGLMQLIPGTGQLVARQLGIRDFRTAMLSQPETNVRLGTKYFKDLVTRFGGVHYALAGYNAGPNRVVRWQREAPGLPADEFIDSIPFAETQAYVKRILGTADDYRRLYGSGVLDPHAGLTGRVRSPASQSSGLSSVPPSVPPSVAAAAAAHASR
jgi:soluble lytic murein transglycosylase